MKYLLKTILLLTFGFSCFAETGKEIELRPLKSKFNGVKVYEQASTSSELITSLEKDQEILILRRANLNGGIWTIAYINGRPGYVLNSELYQGKKEIGAKTITYIKKSNKLKEN